MLHRLIVDNSVYFKEGLNINKLDINFEKFKGITVINAANGMGKTAILEFALPYRYMPSRPGSYKQHFINEKGSVSRIWTINGETYDFILKCNKNKLDCFIYQYINGKWISLLTNSLTEQYDLMVENICGPIDVFLKSVFRNKTINFGDLKESGKREFFINLIGGKKYSHMKKTISDERLKLLGIIGGYELQRDNIIELLNKNKTEILKQKIIVLNNELIVLNNTINENDEFIKKSSDFKAINELQKVKINNLYKEKEKYLNDDLKKELFKSEQQYNTNNTIVEENVLYIKNNNINSKNKNSKITEYSLLLEKYTTLSKKKFNLSELKSKYIIVYTLYNNVLEREKELEKAINREKDLIENRCIVDPSLCKNSKKIEEDILQAGREISEIRSQLLSLFKDKTRETILNNYNAVLNEIEKTEYTTLLTLNDDLANIEKELLFFTKEKLNELNKVVTQISNMIIEKTVINQQAIKENKLLVIKIEELKKKIEDNNNKLQVINNKIKEEEDFFSGHKQINIEELEKTKEKLLNEKDEKNKEKTELEYQLRSNNSLEESLDKVKQEIEIKQTNLNDYVLAENFCSIKDGMPMLILKRLLPQLEIKCNEILTHFYESGVFYQIEFKTTKKASVGKKELDYFDIKITNTNGTTIPLESLSAGQRVIIEVALSLGILRNDINTKTNTLLFDEMDGTLSSDNAGIYYNTLLTILEELHIGQVFMISHNENIINKCNQIITLEKGKGVYS